MLINIFVVIVITVSLASASLGLIRLFDWLLCNAKIAYRFGYDDCKIRAKWLSAFFLYTLLSFFAFIYCEMRALDGIREPRAQGRAFGNVFGQYLYFLIIFLLLMYYFAYSKRGTKYIVFSMIMFVINLLEYAKVWILYTVAMSFSIIMHLGNHSIYYIAIEGLLLNLLIFFFAFMIFYFVRCVNLYKANKKYLQQLSDNAL